ncbi:hypothetical protein QTN25_006544 [Entamoeba marina]
MMQNSSNNNVYSRLKNTLTQVSEILREVKGIQNGDVEVKFDLKKYDSLEDNEDFDIVHMNFRTMYSELQSLIKEKDDAIKMLNDTSLMLEEITQDVKESKEKEENDSNEMKSCINGLVNEMIKKDEELYNKVDVSKQQTNFPKKQSLVAMKYNQPKATKRHEQWDSSVSPQIQPNEVKNIIPRKLECKLQSDPQLKYLCQGFSTLQKWCGLTDYNILKLVSKPFQTKIEDIAQCYVTDGIPTFVRQICNPCEGIFRISGDTSQVSKLKQDIHKKIDITVGKQNASDFHCLASVLSSFLLDLPSPLISYSNRTTLITILSRFNALTLAIRRIPTTKRRILIYLINFYYAICKQQNINKMGFHTISVCVAPSFFSRDLTYLTTTVETIENQIRVLEVFITLYPLLFSSFEEAQNVLTPEHNLSQEVINQMMNNPESIDTGDLQFAPTSPQNLRRCNSAL